MRIVQEDYQTIPPIDDPAHQLRIETSRGVIVTLLERSDGTAIDIRVDPVNRDLITDVEADDITVNRSQVAFSVRGVTGR